MNEQRDILDAAKEMPSSLNDACRTIEVMADEIASLRAGSNLLEKDNNRLKVENIRLRAQLASARKALDAANEYFEDAAVSSAYSRRVIKEIRAAYVALTDEKGQS